MVDAEFTHWLNKLKKGMLAASELRSMPRTSQNRFSRLREAPCPN